MTRTAIRTCPLCEATCGLELELEADRVVGIRGDGEDVLSRGYLCPKGARFGDLEADPDRLTAPLVRRDGQLVETSWQDAFREVARRLHPVTATHGPDAVAVYLGNPNVHSLDGLLYLRPLVRALRTSNVYTASSVDQMPKHVSCGLMFGDPLAIPVPDIDRTDLLVVFGGNPRVSNGSLWTAPDLPGRLGELRRRGGRLIVVDPARTRTAARADDHLAIRPGTDALLLAAVARTLLDDGLAAPGDHVAGLDRLAAALEPFTPERVAPACGIEVAVIRRLARDLAATERACAYGRLGTSTVRFGTVASWLVDVVNVLAGNLDRPGGAMFPEPAHLRLGRRRPFRMGRWASRVRGLPEVIGELPVATLLDEIETPGDGQVRALVCVAGNPVLSTPDGARLGAALADLDLIVCVDPYLSATSRLADVVLPPPGHLHRPHYDLSFTGFAVRNVANLSPAVLPLPDGRLHEWEILLTLAAIALGQEPPVDIDAADDFVVRQLAERVVADGDARVEVRDLDEVLARLDGERGPLRMLDLLLRAGPAGEGFGTDPDGLSVAMLREHPHGVDRGPLQPRLPDVLTTESGRIELAPEPIVADLDHLVAVIDAPVDDGLVLVGRRHLRTNNSWGQNVAALARGRQLCTLQMHPDDAADRGLVDGKLVRVRSTTGEVEVAVEVTDHLRRGVVSLPHGFGHDLDGVRLGVARRNAGVNVNALTDRGQVDAVSGTAVLNAVPVEVEPA